VIVVGGGIAGLMAAIAAKTDNNRVAVITKGNLFKSNSSMASGGINAVLNPKQKDEMQKHIDDTLKGGFGLSDPKVVEYMCKQAPRIITKLSKYGVVFDKNSNGTIAQRSFGGGSSKRTCYVGDKTGGAITGALIKKAKSLNVTFIVNNFVINITKMNNIVSGIVALRKFDSSVMVYPAKSVILAGGGFAGVYRGFSTNAADYTGDTLAIALRAGLSLKDMEFMQFHPTGMARSAYLVSEAARGEGGYLINSDGKRFVNELETRAVVSRAILEQIKNGQKVYIDLRHLPKDEIELKLPSLYKAAHLQAGIDVSKELLEIKPVAHYSMGGIKSNMTKTKIKGLFVCGECSNIGVQGANRLGGNSLLEGAVFGELAGKNAKKFSQNKEYLPIDYNIVVKDQQLVDEIFDKDTTKNFNAMRVSLGKTLFEKCGITKIGDDLQKAYDYLKYLRRESISLHCIDKGRLNNVELINILELRNALLVSEVMVLSSMQRKESRGAHFREDYPYTSNEFENHIMVKLLDNDYVKVWVDENNFFTKLRDLITN
jgi:succinate dehydrogenase/fumarate reductase flavoprotein subunit